MQRWLNSVPRRKDMKIDQWTQFVSSVAGDNAAEAMLRSGDPTQIIELAKSKGFEFTTEDLADLRAVDASGSLSDEVLDNVAGGAIQAPAPPTMPSKPSQTGQGGFTAS
jgi:predicted ribosomally synthesized peptide with nif11-like leader